MFIPDLIPPAVSGMRFQFTLKSKNAKTGPISVTTTPRPTCSDACPFRRKGCYADGGPLSILWDRLTRGEVGIDWRAYIARLSALPGGVMVRLHQAGDFPGDKSDSRLIDWDSLKDYIRASLGKNFFTFCHYDMSLAHNRDMVETANLHGLTVNLSANSPAHADQLAAYGIAPVVCVVPENHPAKSKTPAGRTLLVCPAQQREDMTCQRCGLCAKQHDERKSVIVAFRAHGSTKNKIDFAA